MVDAAVEALLTEAQEESANHWERLSTLVERLDAENIPFETVETLVRKRYSQIEPVDLANIVRDQLYSEVSAYRFYDDFIKAIEANEIKLSIDRDELLITLKAIRAEEAEGFRGLSAMLRSRAGSSENNR